MFTPKVFEQRSNRELHQLIRSYPLGMLLTSVDGQISANHIPFHLDTSAESRILLRCHVARANSVWKALLSASDTLVIFHGPQAYISPNWYPSKQENGRAVPTWNYTAVHVRGDIRTVEDKGWLLAHLTELSESHESAQMKPWKIGDAPLEYIDQMCRMIVGIELEVTQMEGKFKLSQNKSEQDKRGIIYGLEQEAKSDASHSLLLASMVRDQIS